MKIQRLKTITIEGQKQVGRSGEGYQPIHTPTPEIRRNHQEESPK